MLRSIRFLIVLMAFLKFTECLPVKPTSGPPTIKVLNFMQQYGYLKKDKDHSAALYTEEGLSDALKIVQKFGAIEETGQLDNATLKLMASPRCGNPDIIQGKRSKRFTFGSDGWNKRHITYYIANWSSRLGEEKVARLVAKALKTWGAYGGLRISRKNNPDADIIVSFASGAHNDPFPFDGPGYVLAHAYFPNEGSSFSGDIHFDDDEDWVETTPQELDSGTDFYTVALHELGHSLGLGHSNDPNAVMFPYYRGTDENSLQLGHDDILAMYQLYIARPIKEETTSEMISTRSPYQTRSPLTPRRETTTRTTVYTQTPSTSYTTDRERETKRRTQYTTPTSTYTYPHTRTQTESTTRYQSRSTTYPDTKEYPYTERTATWNTNNGYNYSTNDVSTDTRKETGPRITVTINKMPSYSHNPKQPSTSTSTVAPIPDICREKFDAIANLRDEIFVFKDQYVWRYQEQNRLMPGYPVCIKQMFPSLPENTKKIDAAYQRPDGNMVLFIGDHYWVYDGATFTENSPRYITDYGVPLGIGGIDAIQTWPKNGKTYLYKADRFWKYNEGNKTVDPGYPAHIERWRGVPTDLDGSMTWKDGKTYFFKNDQYWKFDNEWVIVSNDSPRLTKNDWLGCR